MIFCGLNETTHPNPKAAVMKVLNDLNTNLTGTDVISAQRLGPKPKKDTKFNRPVRVHFAQTSAKGTIYSNIKKLSNFPQWKWLQITDDYTEREASQQRDLRLIASRAKSLNVKAKLKGKGIEVEGEIYSYEKIDLLPTEIMPASAKTVKMKCGYVFQSRHSFLSNMYCTYFKYNGSGTTALNKLTAINWPYCATHLLLQTGYYKPQTATQLKGSQSHLSNWRHG